MLGVSALHAISSAGCGRIAYDPLALDASTQVDPDSAPAAVPVEFGDRQGADHSAGTRDTYLYQSSPGTNYGTDELLDAVNSSHSLLFFDLSAIAPELTVVAASLCLTPIRNDASMGTVGVHLMTQAWEEGSGGPGAPNWAQRTASENWTTAGGDFGRAIGSFDDVTLGERFCVELDTLAIQDWVSDPSLNLGVGTVSTGYPGEHPHLCSREAVDALCRPALLLSVSE